MVEMEKRTKLTVFWLLIIFGIVFFIWVILWLLQKPIPLPLIIGFFVVTIFIGGSLILIDQFGKKTHSDKHDVAWEYFKNYWKKFRKEEISSLHGSGSKYVSSDGKIFYGFKVLRRSGPKKGQWFTCVVEVSPLNIADWDDNPDDDKIDDPCYKIRQDDYKKRYGMFGDPRYGRYYGREFPALPTVNVKDIKQHDVKMPDDKNE